MWFKQVSWVSLAAVTIFAVVDASTGFPKSKMDQLDNGDVQFDLALLGTPLYHFGSKWGKTTCYPTWPFDREGKKVDAATVSVWPDTWSGCTNQPTSGSNNWGPKFPVYFTVKRCGDDIRVSYSLFFEKDGVQTNGHPYDWENFIVIWRNFEGTYYKDEALLSQHSWYARVPGWANYPETTDLGFWGQVGMRDKDHAKVYVGICKHALYPNKNEPSGATIADCITPNDYRGSEYYNVADDKWSLIRADRNTTEGQRFINNDWGKADSKPTAIWDRLCDI